MKEINNDADYGQGGTGAGLPNIQKNSAILEEAAGNASDVLIKGAAENAGSWYQPSR